MDPTSAPPVLVDDLIPIILESDDHWWPRDFQRLALISPSWVAPVRKRLYAHPSLRSFRACKLFARSLLENPAELLPHLRGLELRPVADSRRVLDEQEMQSLRYILGLKGLRNITLGGDLAVSAERFLHFMADTRAITTLNIDGFLPDDHTPSPAYRLPSLEWDDVVAFRFPSLRSLTLSNVALTVYPPSMDRPGELSDLTLNNVEIVSGLLPDLCQGSWESLRALTVVGKSTVEMDDHIRSMLELCENLEELHYEAVDMSSHPSIFDDDEPIPCESLQKLFMSGFDANLQTLHVIAQACPKLVDVAVLGRMIRIRPEEWCMFIKSGALPCLQRLVAPAGTNMPPFTFWSSSQEDELRGACRSRQIVLGSSGLSTKGLNVTCD